AEGTEVKVLACFKPIVSDYTIMATPDIRQATDLRGKLIATGGTSDLTQSYFDEYFRRNGMRPDDVMYVRIGGQPERADALRAGLHAEHPGQCGARAGGPAAPREDRRPAATVGNSLHHDPAPSIGTAAGGRRALREGDDRDRAVHERPPRASRADRPPAAQD